MRPSVGKTFKSASKSHVGMVRQVNEDAYLDLPENGLWVVADGMGGHAAGDYVSSLIVDSLRRIGVGRSLDEYVAALQTDLQRVNAAVREETAHRGVIMMGSTVVVLATRDLRGVCLWAGDSRLYRLRDGLLEGISRDHSYVQDLQDSGLLSEAEARVHPRANIVTRAIGVEAQLELTMVELLLMPGDSYLLCSDGLNKTVEDHEITEVLSHDEPGEIASSLVSLGLMRGAPDNITVIVVKVPS
ncbi:MULTISPECIES: PP2C family serine/threonine-protein phosphatase [unclassified Pseudomonas]|uniref:PP2C family protein-serine/threonine phosphatase n=1 Tax=unclassified Pseudomonas TaxID=196821 RepID=UPI000C878951|nr:MULTISPECIES: protein phosphatase 2C domain-containing protein [unclassified Pseudomonas]PMU11639.1 serine/threonine protein phosphatase [Pseudomonas sp. FW305-20]PMU21562.1 serine/threonine protein phosphatase [Pseudomonas sp. FW305-122]PMU42093.1 serine/threonine protein phosphatase [Pseudomonas sp. FW305-47B]PMX65734.1 serine/threonine protein phosphatase [Pseudomonas sp. FW305-33]PMX71501.1 serine/threonine protein phosphatase [Pseudomonas sp. FW305-60]